jgi:hypothetical protein
MLRTDVKEEGEVLNVAVFQLVLLDFAAVSGKSVSSLRDFWPRGNSSDSDFHKSTGGHAWDSLLKPEIFFRRSRRISIF